MTVFEAIILGIIQGLTEFLPVSSSGHLVFAQQLMGIGAQPSIMFDLAVHIATLFAVVSVLFKSIKKMFSKEGAPAILKLIAATAPTVLIAVIFKGFFRAAFSGSHLGWGFAASAVLLLFTDFFILPKRRQSFDATLPPLKNITYPAALVTGLFQGAAILPGLSRSGTTICASLAMGADRRSAAELSFLMSVPAILGATLFEALDLGTDAAISIGAAPMIAGFLAALVSGYFAVRFMINQLLNRRLWGFAVYTAVMSIVSFIVL